MRLPSRYSETVTTCILLPAADYRDERYIVLCITNILLIQYDILFSYSFLNMMMLLFYRLVIAFSFCTLLINEMISEYFNRRWKISVQLNWTHQLCAIKSYLTLDFINSTEFDRLDSIPSRAANTKVLSMITCILLPSIKPAARACSTPNSFPWSCPYYVCKAVSICNILDFM